MRFLTIVSTFSLIQTSQLLTHGRNTEGEKYTQGT